LVAPFDSAKPTVVIGVPEVETDPRGRRVEIPPSEPSRRIPPKFTSAHVQRPVKRRWGTPLAVITTILGMLVLFGIIGFAGWLYLGRQQPGVVANSPTPANTQYRNANSELAANKRVVNSPTPQPTIGDEDDNESVDNDEIRSEVTQKLNDWKEQTEALDINSYMAHYAPTVDYYTRPGVSSAFVRNDKQRAFSRYDSLRMNITNLKVTTDASGRTATAIFDKEWDFSGDSNSTGKVRQMMKFRNVDGQWLITAEKDLKVYYTR
jgi:hypothetical protein